MEKKNLIRVLIVVLIIVLLLGLSYLVFRYINSDTSSKESDKIEEKVEKTGKLVVVNSSVFINRNGEEFEVKQEVQEVEENDTIRTIEDSSGYIVFPDNSLILLDFNTEISIDKIYLSDEESKVTISLANGNVWSSVKKDEGKVINFNVKTSNTVASVTGTKFGCNFVSDVNTVCYVTEGKVNISSPNSEGFKSSSLEAGEVFNGGEQGIGSEDNAKDFINDFNIEDDNEFLRPQRVDYINCIDEKSIDFEKVNLGLECKNILVSDKYLPQNLPDVLFTKQTNNYKCSWKSIVADSYKVSISNDIPYSQVNWVETSDTEYLVNEGRTISEYYRCNVIPIVNGQEGAKVSSELLYVDFAFANIEDADILVNLSNVKASLSGIYRNIEITNLMSRFYIHNKSSDMYFNGTDWQTDEYWFTKELVIDGPGDFEAEKTVNLALDDDVEIEYKIEVYNKVSQRVLDIWIIDNSIQGD